jgi:hypothetical protein
MIDRLGTERAARHYSGSKQGFQENSKANLTSELHGNHFKLLVVSIALRTPMVHAYRSQENPRRAFIVWGMDVSKQLVSSAPAHIIAMAIAILSQVCKTCTNDSGDSTSGAVSKSHFKPFSYKHLIPVIT